MTELRSRSRFFDPAALRSRIGELGWRVVLAAHVLLAGFVALYGDPITQDGPAHLYAARILRSLARDPHSPFRRYFESNLHPAGNSLFFYLAKWGDSVLSPRQLGGLAVFVPLLLLPLSVLAFAAALRADDADRGAALNSAGWAAALACPLAYNYFLYRGFYNFVLSVPLALGCLAALITVGASRTSRTTRLVLAIASAALAALAALAHPAALVFLVFAVAAACLAPPRRPRIYAGIATELVLAALLSTSRISNGHRAAIVFSSPASSVMRAVRVLGVTLTWAEAVPALLLLAALVYAAVRALRPVRTIPRRWGAVWPAVCAAAMMIIYFVVPFEYGGAAGLNERIPLFAAVLLLPYVPVRRDVAKWLPLAFAVFAVYVGAENMRVQRLAAQVRDASVVKQIPRGSVAFGVSLQVKHGSLSADLGRHVLDDVALRRDLVMPDVFCSHPAHPLVCKPLLPGGFNESLVEDYEHLSPAMRRASLRDPHSAIRRAFRQVVQNARRAQYLVVLTRRTLRSAFQDNVLRPLGAQRVGSGPGPLLVYRLPDRGRAR